MGKVRELPALGKKQVASNQLVTVGDLEDFKTELLLSIKHLLSEQRQPTGKKWLKTYEVKQLLGISPGTLQTLRNNGTLPFSKIGGIIYYNQEDIDRLLMDRQRKFLYNERNKRRA
ncbi:MAG: helix-turn-helix domain-containing protein [Sphingobacteriales bacterium]|nr:helix-turn-helix domain-containing protein [Sphingobacteriales bacterium]OJW01069.1 MAG: hypothetical protein BGO52_06430 [Sphingobacteriales bacterium 44-61]